MSKISQLHAELSQQASDLGFRSIEEAETHGYTVKYSGDEAFLVPDIDKAHKGIHEAWLKERDEVLSIIESVKEDIIELNNGDNKHVAIEELNRVIDFVEGCHD